MRAIISREGDIQELTVISGDPILAEAALQAGRQWKYKPYLLQGQPVEIESQITMNFDFPE